MVSLLGLTFLTFAFEIEQLLGKFQNPSGLKPLMYTLIKVEWTTSNIRKVDPIFSHFFHLKWSEVYLSNTVHSGCIPSLK